MLVLVALIASLSLSIIFLLYNDSSTSVLAAYYDPLDRTRSRLHEPTHVFTFIAYDICNEKYEQCFNIWGGGNYNHNFTEVTGQGDYVKYKETSTNVLESSWWRALDLLDSSDKHVVFKAEPAVKGSSLVGYIIIQLFEGKNPDSGRICVYGNLFEKDNPSSEDEADCGKANVKIDPAR